MDLHYKTRLEEFGKDQLQLKAELEMLAKVEEELFSKWGDKVDKWGHHCVYSDYYVELYPVKGLDAAIEAITQFKLMDLYRYNPSHTSFCTVNTIEGNEDKADLLALPYCIKIEGLRGHKEKCHLIAFSDEVVEGLVIELRLPVEMGEPMRTYKVTYDRSFGSEVVTDCRPHMREPFDTHVRWYSTREHPPSYTLYKKGEKS